jgi:hypothetical protein
MQKSIKQMNEQEIDKEIAIMEKEFKETPSEYNQYRLEMLKEAKIKRQSK